MYVIMFVLYVYTIDFLFLLKDGAVDISRCCAYFGLGSGPVHLSRLSCTGREQRLINCRYSSSTDYHDEDWSVTCNNG